MATGNVIPDETRSGPSTEFLTWTYLVFSRLNARFERGEAQSMLAWAIETFGSGFSVGTAFGSSGIVLIDQVLRLQPDVDIFYIDTGFFFPESLALIERLQDHYQRAFRRISTTLSVEEQAHQYGPRLYLQDPDRCCHLRKVQPLGEALQSRTAWATALRRDQSPGRAKTPSIVWNERHNIVKLAPLIHWTEEDVWQYIRIHRLPYNELHERHYPSIGCWPCTKAVAPGGELRAGRWQGIAKTECGLHLGR